MFLFTQLKEEKVKLLLHVEEEEELLTNTLLKRLKQTQEEKIAVETAMEQVGKDIFVCRQVFYLDFYT